MLSARSCWRAAAAAITAPTGAHWVSTSFPLGYQKRFVAPMLKEFNKRRGLSRTDQVCHQGREDIPRRSNFVDWNYDAEIFAFSTRLSEPFEDETLLRLAFVDASHAEQLARQRRDLGMEEEEDVADNAELAERGRAAAARALHRFVSANLPRLPADGVEKVAAELMSDERAADVAFHIGVKDLILCKEYPPAKATYVRCLFAFIGALDSACGSERADRFVAEIIGPQLHGQCIDQLWDLHDPMGCLREILAQKGRGEPEPRLLWTVGPETLLASFHVGIYSDRELVGQSPGETLETAEEMAARDAIRRILQTDESREPISYELNEK